MTVGFDPYGLDEQAERRLVAAKSVDALIREAEATASEIVTGVGAHNAGSSFRLRSLAPESGWEPTVVVVAGTALANDETARLAELAGEGGQGRPWSARGSSRSGPSTSTTWRRAGGI